MRKNILQFIAKVRVVVASVIQTKKKVFCFMVLR